MAEEKSGDAENSLSKTTTNADGTDAKALSEQVEKLKNEQLYLRAEFDTYKRNVLKERSELIKYGGERLVLDLLDILDIFDRSLSGEINSDNYADFKKGIEMTASSLRASLQKHGIQEVNCLNEAFNPALHEALSSEETASVPEGHISRVFKKAYKYHEKLLRPAQVVVAKKPIN